MLTHYNLYFCFIHITTKNKTTTSRNQSNRRLNEILYFYGAHYIFNIFLTSLIYERFLFLFSFIVFSIFIKFYSCFSFLHENIRFILSKITLVVQHTISYFNDMLIQCIIIYILPTTMNLSRV